MWPLSSSTLLTFATIFTSLLYTSVALHRHSHSMVEILPPESDSAIQLMQEKPDVTYKDIGGLDMQKQVGELYIYIYIYIYIWSRQHTSIVSFFPVLVVVIVMVIFLTRLAIVLFIIMQEIREAVELPLTHFQLYCQVCERCTHTKY